MSARHTDWDIVLAFFLGAAVSSIAQDPSDTLFFWAQSHGLTSPTDQTFFWYWAPFALYIGLFFLGYAVSRFTRVRAKFFLWFYAALILLLTVFSLSLPQNAVPAYVASVVLGTFISLGIVWGLHRKVR